MTKKELYVNCNKCNFKITEEYTFCPSCGNNNLKNKTFIKRLIDGNFNLGVIFFIFGFLVSLIVVFLMNEFTEIIDELWQYELVAIFYMIYNIVLTVGMIKTFKNFQNKNIRTVLLKISIIVGIFYLMLISFFIIIIPLGT